MSRSTQYIGLTARAKEFVSKFTPIETEDNFTYGMFDEKVKLGVWKDGKKTYKEVLQCSPWSSGPMLFTHLEVDYGNGGIETLLSWIADPDVCGEYDPVKGIYWV